MHVVTPRADFELEVLAYPLTRARQEELIGLLRTEWTRTDYSWIEAMGGDYSAALEIVSVMVRHAGAAVATATIHFSRHQPEVAVLGSVLTHPDYRGHGLAGRAIERSLSLASAAGCRVCLLGTTMRPRNLYHDHGFEWAGGAVMRRTLNAGSLEREYFAAQQAVELRPGDWGDLPGFTLLLAQPLPVTCVDYPRGLMSGRYGNAERCLSNFPQLWYGTADQDGILVMLATPAERRILGAGSVTRGAGPARRHTATIDFAAHEHYIAHLPGLVRHLTERSQTLGLRRLFACVGEDDALKRECLRETNFVETARLPEALCLPDASRDVLVFTRPL